MSDFPTREVIIRGGRTIQIPTLEAKDGMSVLSYNFAGPGWNSTEGAMAARPTGTFDFAAKIHDLTWCILDIASFQPVSDHLEDIEKGRGDPLNRSRQHKADVIFRLMVEHNGNWGIAPWYSRRNFAHERTDFARADDGFVNILNEPNLIAVLNDYRMMPWSELPRSDRHYDIEHDFEQATVSPDYDTPVPQDQRWYAWAKEFYGPVWGDLIAVV
ncbi:MAG: hypothetical protein AAGF11_24135 [Myxococcota bacterium]